MADLHSKQQDVQKQTVNQKHPRSSKKLKRNYCMLCRKSFLKREGQDHMHSMQHHTELEAMLGKDAFHSCQACQINSLSLNEYADHILTSQHQKRFQKLKKSNAKPVPLCKSLSPVTIKSILTRNKELKKEEKKAMRKNKKKQKQSAGEKRANKQHPGVQNRNIDPKTKMLYKSKQLQAGTPNQWAQTSRPGNDHGVILNKENKIYQMQNPPPPPYRPFLDQHWNPPYQPRGPVGQPHPYHYGQQQHIHDCYGYNQQHQMKAKRFQMGSYNSQSASANSKQAMPAISQSNSNQKKPALDGYFTSDQLPQSGAISFDHNQAQKVNQAPTNHRETDPNQPGSTNRSAPGDSENKSSSPAPIQDVDISAMLKQIRRALGVREPCRADREARRQTENVQTEHRDTEKQDNAEQSAATPANTDVLASNCAPPAHAGVSFSTIPPLKGKLSTFKATQETNQTKSQKLKDRPKNDDKGKSLGASNSLPSVSGCTVEHNPLLNKQLHIPGVPNKLSWTEMYDNMKRKTLKGRPRFGVQPTDTGSPAQDSDLPLSEGFHWESIPGSPSVLPPVLPSLHADHLCEAQTDSQTQNSPGQPDVAQQGCSSKTAMQISMKVEPNLEGENEDLSSNSNANKRPRSMLEEDDISPKQRKRKSKKDSPDQNQMDRLLAVSLKEDELSHSLQDLDKALIQARNALQGAYAEVQRLLLLKQQFTAEVNSLRAKRIEILQGMQEGYSRGNPAESASTFSPGAASTGSSTHFSPSLSHPPSAAAFIPPAYPTGLALPGVSLKQEVIHAVAAGQTSQQFLPTAEGSTSTPPLLPESSARDGLKSVKTKILDKEMRPSDFVEGTEENGRREQDQGNGPSCDKTAKKKTKYPHVDDEGSESDSSVEVVNPSNQEIIDIEELEYEHSTQIDAKEQPQDPQTSATADFRIASTQTSQQCETESKHKPEVHPKDNPNPPEASVEEDEPSLGTFSSHTGPVNGLQIHNGRLYTCSGDNTARAYSLVTKECEAVFGGHTNKVNCLLVSSPPNMPTRLYTGSSDQTIRCYSIKSNKCLEQISLPDRVLCLHIAWKILYVGLANGSVISYDLKTLKELDMLECHGPRGVSCLGTTQEGARRLLLVGSYDSTISVRDAKSGLLLRTLEGHTKTVLCLKVVNDLVFSGSSDTSVHAHNIHTGELVRIYKGHSHAVTSIVILGKVMVTACLDQLVRVYELQSHDRLQVYGGHSEMVMCMAVHKSVIYTGCYDGSIQAVKLNLMKNYRCWWQGCSLIFGIAEHLFQHLVREHSNPNLQTIKCRWKECNQFFSTQQSVRQELPEHMQIHINCDSKVQP